VAVFAASLALAACGSDSSSSSTTPTTAASSAGPVVSDPWARASASGQTNGAAYMVIQGGAEDDALISASSPSGVAATIELHETVSSGGSGMTEDTTDGMSGGMDGMSGGMDGMSEDTTDGMSGGMDGMMSMREVASIPVPAGEQVVLEPGGYHIMLIDLTAPLVEGETIQLALQFEKAGMVMVTAEVRA
jgi:copper(I)-binding protein